MKKERVASYTVPFSVARGKWEGDVVITINSEDLSLITVFDGKGALIAECVDMLVYKVFEDRLGKHESEQ